MTLSALYYFLVLDSWAEILADLWELIKAAQSWRVIECSICI